MIRNNKTDQFKEAIVTVDSETPQIRIQRIGSDNAVVSVWVRLAPALDAVDISYKAQNLSRPDPKMKAGLQTIIGVNLPRYKLIHDHPYAVSEIKAIGKKYLRKYPTGDWMTSPQVLSSWISMRSPMR